MQYHTNLPSQTEDAWLRGAGVWQTCRQCGRWDLVAWDGLEIVWVMTAYGIAFARIIATRPRRTCLSCGDAGWHWEPERAPTLRAGTAAP
jgi:hypothetical protein